MRPHKHPAPIPLFDFAAAPGKTDTSAAAAAKIDAKAPTLRQLVYAEIIRHSSLPYYEGLTADEAASLVGEDILAIRPRLSELHNMDLIEDGGKRRQNKSGNTAIVWRMVDR